MDSKTRKVEPETTRTITFSPDDDVRALLEKAMAVRLGVPRSRIINEKLRAGLAELAGKRLSFLSGQGSKNPTSSKK